MVLAGRLVQPDLSKDNTSRKQGILSHSANRIWSIALEVMAIMAAKADSWIMLSDTSKPMAELTLKPVTRMRLATTTADFNQVKLELRTLVRDVDSSGKLNQFAN